MIHVLVIRQPAHIGDLVTTFEEVGQARLVADAINTNGDAGTTAEYLGKANLTSLTFSTINQPEGQSMRKTAMLAYEAALPHRIAYDVLQVTSNDIKGEYHCFVLGGFRPIAELKEA